MPNILLKQLYAHEETTVNIITDNYKQLQHDIKQRYVLSCLTRWLTFKQIQPPCWGKKNNNNNNNNNNSNNNQLLIFITREIFVSVQKAHNSQTVRDKENLRLGQAKDEHQIRFKLKKRRDIELSPD